MNRASSVRSRADWRASTGGRPCVGSGRHLVFLGLCVLAACEGPQRDESATKARAAAGVSSAVPADGAQPPRGTAAPMPAARAPDTRPTIGQSSQEVAGEVSLQRGAKLPLDTTVALPDEASLELHFPGGASVRVLGPARVAVPTGEAGLLLNTGTASVDLERGALHPGSGFWLSTPSVRIDLVQGARFAVRAFGDASSEFTVVSGGVVITSAGAELASAPRHAGAGGRILADGRLVGPAAGHIGQPVPKPPLHLQTEEARLAALAERSAAKGAEPSPAKAVLEAACEQVVTSLTRERELQSQHRALLANKDPAAMQLQRELAQQGARTFEARRTLEKRLSHLEADSLGSGTDGLSSPLIARARELLR